MRNIPSSNPSAIGAGEGGMLEDLVGMNHANFEQEEINRQI